jgi:hypothetical protein
MPTRNRLGPYDTNRVKNQRAQPIGPDENQSIDRAEVRSAWGSSLQDGRLTAENQNLNLEPRRDLNVDATKPTSEANSDHSLPV